MIEKTILAPDALTNPNWQDLNVGSSASCAFYIEFVGPDSRTVPMYQITNPTISADAVGFRILNAPTTPVSLLSLMTTDGYLPDAAAIGGYLLNTGATPIAYNTGARAVLSNPSGQACAVIPSNGGPRLLQPGDMLIFGSVLA